MSEATKIQKEAVRTALVAKHGQNFGGMGMGLQAALYAVAAQSERLLSLKGGQLAQAEDRIDQRKILRAKLDELNELL